jgi:hypothetical protein
MIRTITPNNKLWHTQLNLEHQRDSETNKGRYDWVGPTCCWHFCWMVG